MVNYRALVAGGYFSSNSHDRAVPVAIRMNNPGAVNGAKWEQSYPGYVGTIETTPGNKTTIFETPEHGVAAWWELLRKYRAAGVVTVGGIINRYGGGQDYSGYVADAVRRTGLDAADEIDIDGDDGTLLNFARAMFRHEAGRDSPLTDAQILFGFELARGHARGEPAEVPAEAEPTPARNVIAELLAALFALVRGLFTRTPAPLPRVPSPVLSPVPPPPAQPPAQSARPPWLNAALNYVGFHEIGVNRGIERFIALAKCGSLGEPWCAIFVNACLEQVGLPGTRSAMARSFEHDANFVRLDGPALGSIVTMWRGSPSAGTGHVFFYLGENAQEVLGLAGNQSDGVREAPQDRARIVGYWWPRNMPLPTVGKVARVRGDGVTPGGSEV